MSSSIFDSSKTASISFSSFNKANIGSSDSFLAYLLILTNALGLVSFDPSLFFPIDFLGLITPHSFLLILFTGLDFLEIDVSFCFPFDIL